MQMMFMSSIRTLMIEVHWQMITHFKHRTMMAIRQLFIPSPRDMQGTLNLHQLFYLL
jgi:hypothetical protein